MHFDHIYVHSLPRTGGNAIARFLRDAFTDLDVPCQVHHAHFMTNQHRHNSVPEALLEPLRSCNPDRVGIITSSRDPVARNVSEFWRFAAWRIKAPVYENPQAATDAFYAYTDHWAQHSWHGTELAHFWGLDPFDSVKYMLPPGLIYGRLAMTRLENIRQLPLVVSEWLGLDVTAYPVPHDEARQSRWKEHIRPPLPLKLTEAYLDAMYRPVGEGFLFPRWWYAPVELEAFRGHWTAMIDWQGGGA
jgi:hypothetical protein